MPVANLRNWNRTILFLWERKRKRGREGKREHEKQRLFPSVRQACRHAESWCVRTPDVSSHPCYWNQTQRKWCHLKGSKGTLTFWAASAWSTPSFSAGARRKARCWWFHLQWKHCAGRLAMWAGQPWSGQGEQLGQQFRAHHPFIWSKPPSLFLVNCLFKVPH